MMIAATMTAMTINTLSDLFRRIACSGLSARTHTQGVFVKVNSNRIICSRSDERNIRRCLCKGFDRKCGTDSSP